MASTSSTETSPSLPHTSAGATPAPGALDCSVQGVLCAPQGLGDGAEKALTMSCNRNRILGRLGWVAFSYQSLWNFHPVLSAPKAERKDGHPTTARSAVHFNVQLRDQACQAHGILSPLLLAKGGHVGDRSAALSFRVGGLVGGGALQISPALPPTFRT